MKNIWKFLWQKSNVIFGSNLKDINKLVSIKWSYFLTFRSRVAIISKWYEWIYRSSRLLMFFKLGVQRPKAYNFILKRFQHRCLPVNFAKFLKTPFLQNTSWRQLLNLYIALVQSNQSFFKRKWKKTFSWGIPKQVMLTVAFTVSYFSWMQLFR